MSSVVSGRRATRSSGVVTPAEVRAIGCADDFILAKVYELFSPKPPPFKYPLIIPDAELFECDFESPLEVVRSDADVFHHELLRM